MELPVTLWMKRWELMCIYTVQTPFCLKQNLPINKPELLGQPNLSASNVETDDAAMEHPMQRGVREPVLPI